MKILKTVLIRAFIIGWVFVSIIFPFMVQQANADSSGPNNPSTAANDSSFGTQAWSNPTYISAHDTNKASAILSVGATSQYLVHTSIHERKKGEKLGDTFWGYAC